MKKEKVILIAIIVLTIIGGALASKIKRFNQDYCTTTVVAGHTPGKCLLPLCMSHFLPTGPKVYYTITSDCNKCAQATLDCAGSTSLRGE